MSLSGKISLNSSGSNDEDGFIQFTDSNDNKKFRIIYDYVDSSGSDIGQFKITKYDGSDFNPIMSIDINSHTTFSNKVIFSNSDTTAPKATNIAGGSQNQIPFQTASGTTNFNAGLTFNGSDTLTVTNLAGNASTASALSASGLSIGGVAFDGTTSISLKGVNTEGNQNTTGNAATASKVKMYLLDNYTGGGVSRDYPVLSVFPSYSIFDNGIIDPSDWESGTATRNEDILCYSYLTYNPSTSHLKIKGNKLWSNSGGWSANGDWQSGKLSLQTAKTAIVEGDTLGEIRFEAPNESDGTDAITTAASISVLADGTFNSTSNPSKISIKTADSGTLIERLKIQNTGIANFKTYHNSSTPLSITTSAVNWESTTLTTGYNFGSAYYGLAMGAFRSDGNSWIQSMRLSSDTTETLYKLLINPKGGNVGIGTSSSSAVNRTLYVNGTIGATGNISGRILRAEYNGSSLELIGSNHTYMEIFRDGGTTRAAYIGFPTSTDTNLVFMRNNDSMTIFGRETSGSYTAHLMINNAGNVWIGSNVSSASSNSTKKLYIEGDGLITGNFSADNWTTSSDNRLKHNEQDISSGLDTIMKLKPKTYFKTKKLFADDHNFTLTDNNEPITDEEYTIENGLIAQDLLNIDELKYTVGYGDYLDDNGKTIERAHTVRYNDVFVYNIKATQELYNKNIELENRILQLEQQVQELLKKVN